MTTHARYIAIFLLAGILACPQVHAQAADAAAPAAQLSGSAPEKSLTVVTRKLTPFVIERNGRLSGFSIELWEQIAREADLPFEPDTGYSVVGTVTEMLEAVQAGRGDAGVAAVSITAEREAVLDFSYPFKESGLQILTKERKDASFRRILSGLLAGKIGWLLLGLGVVVLINSHIIWFVERRRNPESFPEGYVAGIWEAVWWSICTIITGGCENKAPLGVAGRLTAIVWMLAGAGLFTYITATITSAMTVETLTTDIQSVSDLHTRKVTVGTVEGSTAEDFLQRQGLNVRGYADVDAACAALVEDKVGAVVYDSPMLLYYAKNHPDEHLGVVGQIFEKQSYGIAVPLQSPYRKEINRAILTLRESGVIEELETRYFGISTSVSGK